MKDVPRGINIRDFVGEKLNHIKSSGNAKDPGVSHYLHGWGKVNNTEALQQSKRGHRGVEVESGRKSSPETYADYFNRIHRLRREQRMFLN